MQKQRLDSSFGLIKVRGYINNSQSSYLFLYKVSRDEKGLFKVFDDKG
ncbi:MAG: hypothetical protein ACTHXN_02850 [Oceanisphaera sp.]